MHNHKTQSTPRVIKIGVATMLGVFLTTQIAVAKNNPEPRIKAEAPNIYMVKKGDTLWDISSKYLKEPWRWKEIWATNRQISNPHRIWPNDKLILCIIEGKRVVGIDTGKGCTGLKNASKKSSTVQQGQIRYDKLSSSISTIPLSAIKKFLHQAQVVDPLALKQTPYVLASKNKNLVTAAGDKIYVRGLGLKIGQDYGVYRIGKAYIDPMTGTSLGQEVIQVAKGVVTDIQNNGVSSLELQKTYRQEVREGDRVFINLDNTLAPMYFPKPGKTLSNTKIIRVHGSLGTAAKNSVVVVNIGQQHGAKPGEVFAIYRKGALVRDQMADGQAVRLPSEKSGLVMIFKTFDNVSYGLVLESDIPIKTGDELKSPMYDEDE